MEATKLESLFDIYHSMFAFRKPPDGETYSFYFDEWWSYLDENVNTYEYEVVEKLDCTDISRSKLHLDNWPSFLALYFPVN